MSTKGRAMLAKLSVHQCSFRKLDRKVTNEVNQAKGAGFDAARVNKQLLGKSYMRPIEGATGALRHLFHEETLPYDDSGWRVLPTENFVPFCQKVNAKTDTFNEAVRELVANYEEAKLAAQSHLNTMWNEKDYPDTPEEVSNKFNVDVEFRPMPESGHLMVDLADEELEGIRKDIEDRTNKRLADAQMDIWRRLLEVTKHFAEVMRDDDKIFKNTTVENVRKICELAPRLNLTKDIELDKVTSQILSTIGNYDPDHLRQSPATRSIAADRAKLVVQNIESAMTGAF